MLTREEVNYSYYTSKFNGKVIPSIDLFNKAMNESVEYFNFKVGNKNFVIDDNIKNCLCALSEEMYSLKNQYSSEGLGSWNVTYSDYSTSPRLKEILTSYVGHLGLMNIWL